MSKQSNSKVRQGDEAQGLSPEHSDPVNEEKNREGYSVPSMLDTDAEEIEETPSLEQQIADLEAKLVDANDQYLRKAADFENFRKRMIREKQELSEFANQNLLLDLLPIIDDFERAIKSAELFSSLKSCKDFSSFYEGIIMIEKRLSSQLESKWGLKRFDSTGQLFDPSLHEAIQMDKSSEVSEAVVQEDYLKGYLLNEKVIRFAKVKVLMPENNEQ